MMTADSRLTDAEIYKVVHLYIGVSGGYLGDFSYSSHQQFYYVDCELSHIVTGNYPGTTRARFISILNEQTALNQAKILRGTLNKYTPENAHNDEVTRNRTANRAFVEGLILRLQTGTATFAFASQKISSETVRQALADTQVLLKESGPASAVDRVHTVFHGYLIQICENEKIPVTKDLEITGLFKLVKKQHPAFSDISSEIERILGAQSAIVDALNPLRNRKSLAHPNETVLEAPEATLVINTVAALLNYIDAKIQAH
jgi:hypothetical protein